MKSWRRILGAVTTCGKLSLSQVKCECIVGADPLALEPGCTNAVLLRYSCSENTGEGWRLPAHHVLQATWEAEQPWEACDPGSGKAPGVVLGGSEHTISWHKYSAGWENRSPKQSLRRISLYKAVPSGALKEHWIYRGVSCCLCFSAHGSALPQSFSCSLHCSLCTKRRLNIETPQLSTCHLCPLWIALPV